jgi:hypothetical protein
MQKLILGNYTHGDQKALLVIIALFTLGGAIKLIMMASLLFKFLLTITLIFVLFYLLTFIFGKKGLLFIEGQFYYGIAINSRFLIKRRIKLNSYSNFSRKSKIKSQGHWFLDLNGLGIFYNHHECLVLLNKPKSKKKKLLISLAEAKSYGKVKSFLIQNSSLEELKEVHL